MRENMKYRAVIFDLDGTLLDTLDDLADAANRVLADAGLPVHPRNAYRYFVGNGLPMLIRRILPQDRRGDEEVGRLSLAFREDYGQNWHVKTKLYAGVAAMLTGLRERGVVLAVLSNKPDDFTRICVRRFLGGWRFEVVLGQRSGVPKKPDPAGALEIAGLLDLPPAEILYLGDSDTDMKTARAAGMFPVGAAWGFRTAEELRASGAAELAGRPEELLGFFRDRDGREVNNGDAE